MASGRATAGRSNVYRPLDEVNETHESLVITGKRARVILTSEGGRITAQATLHLLSSPRMREFIREGMTAPVDECFGESER